MSVAVTWIALPSLPPVGTVKSITPVKTSFGDCEKEINEVIRIKVNVRIKFLKDICNFFWTSKLIYFLTELIQFHFKIYKRN